MLIKLRGNEFTIEIIEDQAADMRPTIVYNILLDGFICARVSPTYHGDLFKEFIEEFIGEKEKDG